MKYSILLILLCIQLSFCQDKKSKKIIQFYPQLRLNVIVPNNFGDNYLSKANKSDLGIGLNFNFLKFDKFKLGAGYNYIYYSITDISRAGNINSSRYSSFYGATTYEYKVSKHFIIEPYIGLGTAKINFKSAERSFGSQTGTDFRIGFNTDYKIDETITAFIGLGYVQTKYNIKTAPEFVSFYDHSKMLQIQIGLKIN
jgi:hypothetical protein